MGIAVHPTQPWVYVCYSTQTDDRVVRYTLAFDGMGRPLSLSAPTPIVSGIDHNDVFHQGCRIRFQPGTTNLFITTGDNGVGTEPQDVDGLNGKVLRVTDAGANPGNVSGKLWFTAGHRNPQGITFRPGTNEPYSAEHGPGIDDEINRLTDNGNAGWNPVPGYNQGVAMTDLSLPNAFAAGVELGQPHHRAVRHHLRQWSRLGDVERRHHRRRPQGPRAPSLRRGRFRQHRGRAEGLRQRDPAPGPVQGPDGALYVATDVSSPGGEIWRVTKN